MECETVDAKSGRRTSAKTELNEGARRICKLPRKLYVTDITATDLFSIKKTVLLVIRKLKLTNRTVFFFSIKMRFVIALMVMQFIRMINGYVARVKGKLSVREFTMFMFVFLMLVKHRQRNHAHCKAQQEKVRDKWLDEAFHTTKVK